MFSASSSSDPGVLSVPCLSGVASLHALNVDGSINPTAIATSSIATDGSFNIPDARKNGVTFEGSNVQYMLEASGCGNTYYRPLTDYLDQSVTGGSTLLGLSTLVNDGSKRLLNQIPTADVKNVLANLDATPAATLTALVNTVVATPSLANSFQNLVNFPPTKLKDIPPNWNVTAPINIPEFASASYSVNVSTWNTDYVPAYQWILDGVVVSTAHNWSFAASKNSQGSHQVVLKVGEDNAGNIDLTKPVKTVSVAVMVSDDFPATAPTMTLASAEKTNSNIGSVDINTGTALVNCDTFSSLALSEDSIVAPPASAFTITCTQAGTQNQAFTLSSGDGLKTLALWVKDASGNISVTPSTVTVLLDQTNPNLTLSNLPPLAGGTITNVTYSTSDAGSGLQSVLLDYASDGLTFVNVTDLIGQSSPYAWSVPTDNTVNAKIRITATDRAGNSSQLVSSAFIITSSGPTLNLSAINSGQYKGGTSQNITWTTSDAGVGLAVNPIKLEYTADNGTTWNTIVAATANSSPYSWTLPAISSNQVKVRVTSTDAVGNANTAISSAAFTIDTTGPSLSLTSLNSGSYQGGSTQSITWTASDALSGLATNPIKLEYTSNNGTTWNTIAAATANTGTYSWTLPSIDSNQVEVRITATDAVGNSNSVSSSSAFTIDSTPPVLSSVTINGGATYAGTFVASMTVGLSDNFSAGSQISVRFAEANVGTSDCQSQYSNDSWQTYTNASTGVLFNFTPSDGVKKICAWAKDLVGNVSVISSPTTGTTGVNYNTIVYQTGNIPQITAFSVTRNAGGAVATSGDAMTINWATTDVEGLDNNPISFAYTTNNTLWKDIVTGLDASVSTNVTWFGGLSGNPTSASGSITTWTAPSSSYFRVRAIAKDMATNTSIVAFSQVFNTGGWSIYAGSRDRGVGGVGKSAAIYSNPAVTLFTINPKTGDIYALDTGGSPVAIRKLSAATGLVSTFIASGTKNLPKSGTIPTNPQASIGNYATPFTDSKGRIYIQDSYNSSVYATNIYQIDPVNNTVLLYAGGGTGDDGGAGVTSTSINMIVGNAVFDDQDSLYVWSYCGGLPANNPAALTTNRRLLKITQNSDGTPGTVTRVIGNCTTGNPTSGSTASNSPLPIGYGDFFNVAAWNGGADMVVFPNNAAPFKIINGIVRTSNLSTNSINAVTYNPIDGYVYRSFGSGIYKVSVNLAGDNGEVSTLVVNNAGAVAGCNDDGTLAANFCGAIGGNMSFQNGLLYFAEGAVPNQPSNYTVRYVDSSSKIHTVLGTKAFYGDGMDRSLIRGYLSGIYYKKSSEPNQAAFPEGLYFNEYGGVVFGKINPSTNVASVIWGSQLRTAITIASVSGATASSSLNMGQPYYGGNAYGLTFDDQGLPWMRAQSQLVSLNASQQIVPRTAGGTMMQSAPDGANPYSYQVSVYETLENMTLKGSTYFSINNYSTTGIDPLVTIRELMFGSNAQHIILGGNYTASQSTAASPDIATPGAVAAAPLYYGCINGTSGCKLVYNSTQDRLYFSENASKIRYITTPDNTATSTLTTVFTSTHGGIANFIFTPDSSQLWYLAGSGLYCYDLSSGKSWCDNTTNHWSPMSAAGFSWQAGANQLTFKDNSTLFMSTYLGEILQFNLPTGP